MAKARILAVVIIGALLLTAFVPFTALGDAGTPGDLCPADGTDNISLTPTFVATYTGADAQFAAWWQCTRVSGNYSADALVFDTGVDQTHLEGMTLSRGLLEPSTTYYWRVRQQDIYGNWSPWSAEQEFTTVELLESQTTNSSPVDGATDVDPSHNFEVLYVNPQWDEIAATQWQWTTPESRDTNADGSYKVVLYDSGIVAGNSLLGVYPVGTFGYGKTYWWHARVQDVMGIWSDWSDETSFTVVTNSPPNKPINAEPLDGATAVSTAPVLKASDFSDPNISAYVVLNDTHDASQWQVTATAGNYASPAYDSGSVTTGLVSIAVPAGRLSADTKYYWHVRYQDSYGNWSGYSAETSFTTKSISAPAAVFTADKTEVTAGAELVTFTDNSTPSGEIIAWHWDWGDGTSDDWATRPSSGKITHKYTDGGYKDVKLTVTTAATTNNTDTEEKTAYILVHAKPEALILVAPVAPKAGKDTVFTDKSAPTEDITSWEWNFGDGATQEWDKAASVAAGGKITHVYKKAGKYLVTLRVSGTVGGHLEQSVYNKQLEVTGGGGLHFGLWMVGVAVAVLIVVAGGIYLLQSRRTAK